MQQLLQFQWTNFNLTSGMFLCWSSFKIVQRLTFYVELWLLRHHKGRKIPKLSNPFLHNLLVRFQNNLVEMFIEWPDPLQKLFKSYWFRWKAGQQGGIRKGVKWQKFIIPFFLKFLLDFKIQMAFTEKPFYYFFKSVHSLQVHLQSLPNSSDRFRAVFALLFILILWSRKNKVLTEVTSWQKN